MTEPSHCRTAGIKAGIVGTGIDQRAVLRMLSRSINDAEAVVHIVDKASAALCRANEAIVNFSIKAEAIEIPRETVEMTEKTRRRLERNRHGKNFYCNQYAKRPKR